MLGNTELKALSYLVSTIKEYYNALSFIVLTKYEISQSQLAVRLEAIFIGKSTPPDL